MLAILTHSLRHHKTKFLFVSFFLLLIGLVNSAFTEKKTPIEQTKLFCLENIKAFQAQLDSLQKAAEQKAERKELTARFKDTRVAFKRFEFLIEYLDNNRYPFFNGVNAVENDEGFNPNAQPEGLQVIETELCNDSLNYNRIVFLIKQLKYRTLTFYLLLKDAQLKDTYIFEAIRFDLIRIESLSLVSFDSPKVRNNIEEISVALASIKTVLSFYKDDKNSAEITASVSVIESTLAYLKNKTFSSLDRLYFIKNYLQPITKNIETAQEKSGISYFQDAVQVFRAVNLSAKTIYDADFLNAKFYAQDKYHQSTPKLLALGKQLFFDKRLSADGSLSCASCHQAENAFTDKLPTAITNKPGDFQKRNTPTIINAALQAAYFYDLSATTLETQIDHVVINPQEYNHNYDAILKRLKSDTTYVRMFEEAFPQFKKDAISIYAINTSIADFERQFVLLNSPFDKYMRGQTSTIDASVKRGFNLFMGKAQCGSCHFAPTFFGTVPPFYGTSESEVLGVTKTFDTIHPVLDDDIGRYKIFEMETFRHAMKISTVRNADLTAPYMHNGGFKTLEEVIEFYNQGGGAGMKLNVPNQTLPADKLNLTKQDKKDIISFIKALTDTSGIKSLL